MKSYHLLIISLLAVLFSSCMPTRYLPYPEDFQKFVNGSVIIANSVSTGQRITGELLAATKDSLVVKSISNPFNNDEILTYATNNLKDARLRVTSATNSPGGMVLWSALLIPLTLTHGWIAIFTLPVNLINCLVVSISISTSYYTIEIPQEMTWEEAGKFARFPQGWPAGLNKKDLL